MGGGGNVLNETRSAIYDMTERPKVIGFHTGMAGDEVTPQMIRKIAEKTLKSVREPVPTAVEWVGGA